MKYFFAVDLGATSGRTITGHLADGKIVLEELTRFDNPIIEQGGYCYWDLLALYNEIIKGLKKAHEKGLEIQSVGIDTWGVDFVCFGDDGRMLRTPTSYRDLHPRDLMDKYFKEVVPKEEVYRRTGIQFMYFNSLFQLYSMREHGDSALKAAKKILFLPDALTYMISGKEICEYTIASTSSMLNPATGDLDERLLQSVGHKREQFGEITNPGTVVGTLTPDVQKLTGYGPIPVVAVAGHDTASAVAAVPAKDKHFAYLSSGTWSLMGIETPEAIINDRSYGLNFTNEGGIEGTTRFLKNICGMWIYERCRQEWPETQHLSHYELQKEAYELPPSKTLINPDDPAFANPDSMLEAIKAYCEERGMEVPQGHAQVCRCIFDSLANRYREVFGWLKEFAPFEIDTLHIIGGGSKNYFLDQLTADACGVTVLAGPQEGTALGNIMLQAKASGLVKDVWEMRKIISNSIELKRFEPRGK